MRILLVMDEALARHEIDPGASKWVPRQDILAHPLLSCYTHGSATTAFTQLRRAKLLRTRPSDECARNTLHRIAIPPTLG